MLPTATESCASSAFAFAAGGGISWKELSASRSGRAQGGGQERVFQVGRGLCSSQKCPYIPAEQCCVVVFSLKGQEYSTFSGNLWLNLSRSGVPTAQARAVFTN